MKDSVYSFEVWDYENFFNNVLDMVKRAAGEELRSDFEIAIREEYSTFGWIMEGMLQRAGFHIDRAEYSEGFMAVYFCTKRK